MHQLPPPGVQALHERLGRVSSQPVSVSSFTNKRLTINYRAPVESLRQLVPPALEVDQIRDTGFGMISQCVCDFNVNRFGWFPIPQVHASEMLCRISVKVPKENQWHRAYYTLRSDTSSTLLGVLGGRFSHFRKAISQFSLRDDGEVYEVRCTARDSLCSGHCVGYLSTLSLEKPETTCFSDIAEATEFVLQLDGSAGYDYESDRLSFQRIEYPPWDLKFCHHAEYSFGLLSYLFEAFDLRAEFDCMLFMEKVPQIWGATWLYAAAETKTTRAASTLAAGRPNR
jgi:hypothetical protein